MSQDAIKLFLTWFHSTCRLPSREFIDMCLEIRCVVSVLAPYHTHMHDQINDSYNAVLEFYAVGFL